MKTTTPKVPQWLGDDGKKKWRELIRQLPDLTKPDLDTLAILCNAWQLYYQAQRSIDADGINLVCQNGRLFVNPSIAVLNEERKAIVKLSKMFGLQPAFDRPAPADDGDEFFND
ncbi:MAG: hypothetical protein BIFFINMI_03580 [Phycisphaerae bacterium]|nr:hypothetical protein [Phycisphaerae bacterium]